MHAMDWTNTTSIFTIIGSFVASSAWFYKLLKDQIEKTESKLEAKVDQNSESIKHLSKDLTNFRVEVGERMANIVGQITK